MNEEKKIHAQKGKVVTILLQASPSSGYEWVPEYDTAVLKLLKKEFVAIDNRIGGEGVQRFEFEALTNGLTKLRMVHKRPWETVIFGEQTYTIHIAN